MKRELFTCCVVKYYCISTCTNNGVCNHNRRICCCRVCKILVSITRNCGSTTVFKGILKSTGISRIIGIHSAYCRKIQAVCRTVVVCAVNSVIELAKVCCGVVCIAVKVDNKQLNSLIRVCPCVVCQNR